jgi:acetyl esterase/lipase
MDFMARLEPETAARFSTLPDLDLTDIPAARIARQGVAATSRARVPVDPGVVTTDHTIRGLDGEPDVLVRHYRPSDQNGPLPCLIWVHGGGHVIGEMSQDDPTMERFVATIGCVCISVEWRRPPEHPFPAPMNDCYAALLWAYHHAGEIGVDPRRIAVGGASSGGGSAAGLALLARDKGEVPIVFQLLIYPMLDDRAVTPSSRAITNPQVWNDTKNEIAWRAYLGAAYGTDDVSPYSAPSRATDLSDLPPAYICTGDLDLFLDEDIDYAQRLLQAGVPTELHVYAGGIHGFDLFVPDSPLAQRFIRDRDDALRRGLFG